MRRYLQTFFVLSMLVLVVTIALSYWQLPLRDGALTRIGFYSERDYGWKTQQIEQFIEATGVSVKQPNFWILGDSFSRGNAWQSVIQQQSKLTSQTFHYESVGCLKRWVDQAAGHPSIRTVVAQVAQLSLLTRFAQLAPCGDSALQPLEVVTSSAKTKPSKDFHLATDWRIKHSALTQINTWRINHLDAQSLNDDQVANSPLKPNCANFSNRRSDRVLYQTGSLDHPKKTAATYDQVAKNLLTIQTEVEAQGKQFVLVVIPDKFSAYQYCIADSALGGGTEAVSTCNFLTSRGIKCVNLMPAIQLQRLATPDLYLPNDTHFSHAGYRLLADAVLPYLR